jgi:hypothetical protein
MATPRSKERMNSIPKTILLVFIGTITVVVTLTAINWIFAEIKEAHTVSIMRQHEYNLTGRWPDWP